MTFRKTLLLAALLGAVLLYIFKIEVPKSDSEKAKTRPFDKVSAEALKSIEISISGQSFTLVNTKPKAEGKEGDGADEKKAAEAAAEHWTLAGIQGAQIDPGSLNALVSPLVDLDTDTPLPEGEVSSDPAVYGLSAPQLSLRVDIQKEGARKLELQFGKKNDYLNKRYLKITGADFGEKGRLFLVPETLFSAANKNREAFRKKTPYRAQRK